MNASCEHPVLSSVRPSVRDISETKQLVFSRSSA